jgi:hypothetical protein
MPGLVAVPDAKFFVKAQQNADFHALLAAPGLRLRVIIPRPVFWELDNLRFAPELAYTVREVRRRLEQLLRSQQERGALVTYETDLDTRLVGEGKADEQLVAYLVQRARRYPRERYVLISDEVGVRNFALLSPEFQQLHNVHVSSMEEWRNAAEWLAANAEPGDVSGWAVRVTPDVIEEVDGERYQGLRIGVACDISNYPLGEALVRLWFQDAATEVWLEDRNGQYQPGGYVTLSDRVAVTSERERVEKSYFMPYDELHLPPGQHQLAVAVNLLNPRVGRQIGESGWAEFNYRERDPVATFQHAQAQVQRATVAAGETPVPGVAILTSFTLDGARGRQADVRVYFRDESTGSQLMDRNGRYACDSGLVCTSTPCVPQQEHARFRQFPIFIPLDELHLTGDGPHRLACVVTLWAAGQGRELAESDWVAFEVREDQAGV